jgi:integrase/recombinase XerD
MPARGQRKRKPILGDPSDPHGMAAMLAAYLDAMRVTNYTERTVQTSEWNLKHFVLWCQERSVTRPLEVTRPILQRYQRWLYHYRSENGRPLSFRSQQMRLVPVKGFFRYLAKNNYLLYNPASELELPRREKRLPRFVLTAAEAERVINQTDIETPFGLRDRAILETLYSTGIRRCELVALKLYDVDLDRGTVMVRQGKGKKDRMVPIGERAVAWIEKYLADVRPTFLVEPDDGALFLTHAGDPFVPDCLSQLVREYVEASGVGKKGACHLFRHTMATVMLENGADIRFIQEMLGHATLETTQIYTQVSIRKLKEIHTATHPSARLERKPTPATTEPAEDEAREILLSSLAAEAAEKDPNSAGR